jgi:hydroxymethylpyrimidine/phosphomethylpyrimidine kinase
VVPQNSLGVGDPFVIPADVVEMQLAGIFEDYPVAGVKVGLVCDASGIIAVAKALARHASRIPIVVDPVLSDGRGEFRFLDDAALDALMTSLMPLATVLTPNLPEAATLLDEGITPESAGSAAERIVAMGPQSVLLKVGHSVDKMLTDIYADAAGARQLAALQRVGKSDVHGTGCQLASAILCELLADMDRVASIERARNYLWALIQRRRARAGHGRPMVVRTKSNRR